VGRVGREGLMVARVLFPVLTWRGNAITPAPPGDHKGPPAGINPVAATPQERPEIRAIREALLLGDKMKAIKLYRSLYGGSMKEAQDALDTM